MGVIGTSSAGRCIEVGKVPETEDSQRIATFRLLLLYCTWENVED